MADACQNPRCVMRLGAVVRVKPDTFTERRHGQQTLRGVVGWSHGHGDTWARTHAPLLAANDACIEHSPGMWTVTNVHGEWEAVPDAEQTSVERVKSVGYSWQPPTWRDADDQDYEPDSFVFACLRALLSEAERGRVFNDFEWPSSTWELLLSLAEAIDGRVAGNRALGKALGRLG